MKMTIPTNAPPPKKKSGYQPPQAGNRMHSPQLFNSASPPPAPFHPAAGDSRSAARVYTYCRTVYPGTAAACCPAGPAARRSFENIPAGPGWHHGAD